jgi:penicillin-binding protein activator
MKTFKILLGILIGSLMTLGLISCSGNPKITRTEVDAQIDLSGNWNDTDSRMVSQEMVTDCTGRPWMNDFALKTGKKPRVIVGTIVNKSQEHINTEVFTKDLEIELTNSGRVIFVASKDQRTELRDEKADQAQNASLATAKSMGQEYGADYMLKGDINTTFDAAGKQQLRYYKVSLELIDLTTNEKVWIGEKEIKKVVKNSKTKI